MRTETTQVQVLVLVQVEKEKMYYGRKDATATYGLQFIRTQVQVLYSNTRGSCFGREIANFLVRMQWQLPTLK